MEALLVFWLLFGILGALIGASKQRAALGFLLGLLFGPLGLLFILFTRGSRKKCPYCRELVQLDAVVCPHCQKDLKATAADQAAARPAQNHQTASQKSLGADLKKFKGTK